MARRGKAANRQARQRRQQRAAAQRGTARPAPPQAPSSSPVAESAESAETGLGRTATSSNAAATTTRSSVPASQRGARTNNPRLTVAGPSRLSARAQEEYHYVARDLRNIGMLVVVMAAILLVAFVAFTALGIGKAA
jgi:hypothetical protein